MATSAIHSQTAAGGQAVVITGTDGAKFFVSVINGGTVRATPASNGRANIIVDGSTSSTLLEINRVVPKTLTGKSHTFMANGGSNSRLNLASVTISSGMIGAVEGYQTANLSGPLNITGSTRVDRIALGSILPGGSITTSGDVNTLDIYNNVTLNNTNISIGRDLNWFQVFGNLSLTNNSSFTVGRDLGGVFQPAKGSGNAGEGAYVGGNLSIDQTSNLVVTRNIPYNAGVLINGNFTGATRFSVGGFTPAAPSPTYNFFNVAVYGSITA